MQYNFLHWVCIKGGKQIMGSLGKLKASNLDLFTDQIFTLVTLSRPAIINSHGLIPLPLQIARVVKLEH